MSSTEFEALASKVEAMKPLIREHRGTAERERTLAAPVVEAMLDAGLLRAWVPKAYGGFELHPVEAVQLWESIAKEDAAAGWIASNQSAVAYLTQVLPESASASIWLESDALIAGGWFPPAPAVRVEGGFRVTGQWAFGSGCRYATWLTGQAIEMENGQPKLNEAGLPNLLIIFFPRADGDIIEDSWDALGMRGTGSNDIRVHDLFVPDAFTWSISPLDPPAPFRGPLYGMRLWFAAVPIAAVALGIASAALRDLMALASQKTPSYTTIGLADRSIVQDQLARVTAKVDAARDYLHSTLNRTMELTSTGSPLTPDRGLHLQLASTHAIVACQEAVDTIQTLAGTTGIRESAPFERHFRDIHTLSQHAFGSGARFESVGKLLLGRESDWGFFYL
ncbi:hypothetical protein AYO38_03620 [bacterium SCGC AG-212-C10]|nr:hypothetical protein AYO38_03620 [bacterium SCGC AG-212-C10]